MEEEEAASLLRMRDADEEEDGFGWMRRRAPPEPAIDADSPVEPLWRSWPGLNLFFCDGRCMMGPSLGNMETTLGLIFGAMLFLHGFVLPQFVPRLWLLAGVTSAVLTVLALVFLVSTALTEPGIIPRRPQSLGPPAAPPRSAPGFAHPIPPGAWKFCETCNVYRPPRSKHCRDTDNCVLRFDHYCPWVANTVGLRNYRFFVAFVLAVNFLALLALLCSLWAVLISGLASVVDDLRPLRDDPAWGARAYAALADANANASASANANASGATVAPVWPQSTGLGDIGTSVLDGAFALFLLIMLSGIGGLGGFHCVASCCNVTTYEMLRRQVHICASPHSLGCLRNLWHTLCAPIPPSLLPDLRQPFRGGYFGFMIHHDQQLQLRSSSRGSLQRSTEGAGRDRGRRRTDDTDDLSRDVVAAAATVSGLDIETGGAGGGFASRAHENADRGSHPTGTDASRDPEGSLLDAGAALRVRSGSSNGVDVRPLEPARPTGRRRATEVSGAGKTGASVD